MIIIPHYKCLVDVGVGHWEENITYRLGTQLPWLNWDSTISGWKGVIPHYSQIRTVRDEKDSKVYRTGRVGAHAIVNILRIDVLAVRTETSRSGIRVERTLRARLTIKVKPYWVRERTVSANLPLESREPAAGGEAQDLSTNHSSNTNTSSRSNSSTAHTDGGSTGCSSLSLDHLSSRLEHVAKQVMANVADSGVLPTIDNQEHKFKTCQPQINKGCSVESISDQIAHYGLSDKAKTEVVYDNDIHAYPITAIPTGRHNSHIFTSPYSSARRMPSFNRASGFLYRGPSTSVPIEQYCSFLTAIQESLSATRSILRFSDQEDPVSPTVARRPSTSLETLQRVPQRQVTLQPVRRQASEDSLDRRHAVVQPASAELFAIAQSLHSQPDTRKRARGSSFEQSPTKRNREVEHEELELSGYASDSILTNAHQSNRSYKGLEGGVETPLTPISPAPPLFSNRYGVLADPGGNTDTGSDKGTKSSGASSLSESHSPFNDPHIQKEQALLRSVLCEIPSGQTERISLQERKDLYEAFKKSTEDAEKMRYERIGIHLSEGFTESRSMSSGSEFTVGRDLQEPLANITSNNAEGTETSQATSDGAAEPRVTYRVAHIYDSTDQSSIESRPGSKMSSGGQSNESSDFEENPAPALDTTPLQESQDQTADAEPPEDSQKAQENRRTPLMGFFGAGTAARSRGTINGPRNPPRSKVMSIRTRQPRCYGCEIQRAERE